MEKYILEPVIQTIVAYVPNGAKIYARFTTSRGQQEEVDLGLVAETLYALIRKELTGKDEDEE